MSATGDTGTNQVEWPTLAMLVVCYVGFGCITIFGGSLPALIVIPLLAAVIALHSSLQHEVLHGHPFRNRSLSEATVFPAIGLFVPYLRFRETHLDHHRDPNLTDPYDDPESNYLDPKVWDTLSPLSRAVLVANNYLIGRILLGPAIGTAIFYYRDWTAWRSGTPGLGRAYLHHAVGVTLVLLWLVTMSTVAWWVYGAAAYFGLSLIKIRSFLEHQAHESVCGRTVIIEDKGLLSVLFLNNNLHLVHHAHPQIPWYDLPTIFEARREAYLARNYGYSYTNYRAIFARYLFQAKDPVRHPFYRTKNAQPDASKYAHVRSAKPAPIPPAPLGIDPGAVARQRI